MSVEPETRLIKDIDQTLAALERFRAGLMAKDADAAEQQRELTKERKALQCRVDSAMSETPKPKGWTGVKPRKVPARQRPGEQPKRTAIETRADALETLVEERGGKKDWVKLTYLDLREFFKVSSDTVPHKAIAHALTMGRLRKFAGRQGSAAAGNYFTLNASLPEPDGASASKPAAQSKVPAKPVPPLNETEAEAIEDAVLGVLLGVNERLGMPFQVALVKLARAADVKPGEARDAMRRLRQQNLIGFTFDGRDRTYMLTQLGDG